MNDHRESHARTLRFLATRIAALSLAVLAWPAGAIAQDSLGVAGAFSDHMVLQRQRPVAVRGSAPAGAEVTVRFAGQERRFTAGEDGAWSTAFPALEAGGPHVLEIGDDTGASLRFEDVLVGDVFLCSGQSNMAWPVSASTGGPWGPSGPDAGIRLLQVPRDVAPTPLERYGEGVAWQVADESSVPPFSGVCWHFGQALRAGDDDVPLGLVNASWGGSRIEPWISAEGLASDPAYAGRLALLARYAQDPEAAMAEHGATWEAWWRELNDSEPWTEPSGTDAGWTPVPGGLRNWQTFGPEWERLTGMVWYRGGFELDAARAGRDATLVLGPVDEVDVTWVNGRFVGGSFGWGEVRRYPVPAEALQAGANDITVNVYNGWGAGGLTGPDDVIRLEWEDGHSVPVTPGWSYRRVAEGHPAPAQPPWESVGGLTGMFNAMLAPLRGQALAGALWYQGESNTGEGRAYGDLLAGMSADWRRQFQDDLPVLVIQLPAFGGPHTEPVDAGWAQLRDGQRRVAAAEPATALVVTLDLGDTFDLHPPHKAEVGRRAARVFRSLRGDGDDPVDGIQPVSVRRDGDVVQVDFEVGQGPFTPLGAGLAHGFELCDAQGNGCRFVPGEVDGNAVRLPVGEGPAERVRHCWADAPACNLVGVNRWPVSSFESAVSR